MNTKTLRTTFVVMGLLLAVAPAWGQYRGRGYYERDGAFRLRLGSFLPEGSSEYWEDKEDEFTGDVGDLENVSFGADYLLSLSPRVSLQFGGSVYEGDTTQAYLDFVDNFGDEIRHDTTLSIASANLGVVLNLTGPDSPIIPYIGAGAGAYFWQLEEDGDFIDFGTVDDEIFSATLQSEGVAFGYYGLVGLEAPLSPRFSLFAEGRWTQAEDELSDDLEGLGDVDLSGREFAVGLSWNL